MNPIGWIYGWGWSRLTWKQRRADTDTHTPMCGYGMRNISLVLSGNTPRPLRSILRDSGVQEKTILISWMDWLSTWDHGKDPVTQFLPKWLSDMACSHAHTRITPFCLFGGGFYSSLKLLKELQVLSVPTALSGKDVQKESSLEEGHSQLLVSHLIQQGPCYVHNPEEFLQYNEITWKTVLIITTSITQHISNQRVKSGWIRCQPFLSETLEDLPEGWDVSSLN